MLGLSEDAVTTQPRRPQPNAYYQRGHAITSQPKSAFGSKGDSALGFGPLNAAEKLHIFEVIPPQGPIGNPEARFDAITKYIIRDMGGQRIYVVEREAECLSRFCMCHLYPYLLRILDNRGNVIINMERKCKCDCCWCCGPCLQKVIITDPQDTNNPWGWVTQECGCCSPRFVIRDSNKQPAFRLKGPCCPCFTTCCVLPDIPILTTNRKKPQETGYISKVWNGPVKEHMLSNDRLQVFFPTDTDVKMKGVIVGATFLMEVLYYEGGMAM